MTFYIYTQDGDSQNKTDDFAEACQIAADLSRKGGYVVGEDGAMVHRAAWEPAEAGHLPSQYVQLLTSSLDCYVTGDDLVLDREAFLRLVVDRIQDDLHDKTF